MLYILFSPSEGKHSGGHLQPESGLLFDIERRRDIITAYINCINEGTNEQRSKMCGLKKVDELERYRIGAYDRAPKLPAIDRYSGVAYEYLDVTTLDSAARSYLLEHLLIFSNLYGPLHAGDAIIDYKVKQGESIGAHAPDHYYMKRFSNDLDQLFKNQQILDLRAGYYDKFYKPVQPYTTLKFLKDGKVVSHWAKAYRGLVLRSLAENRIESLEAFGSLEIPHLHVREIQTKKYKTEIIFEIV